MNRWHLLGWLGMVMLSSAAAVHGQGPPGGVNPASRPAFSPYLNLNRPGTAPALNYYGLVRPQQAFGASIQRLQQQTNALELQQQQPQAGGSNTKIPLTGHKTGFMTHTSRFLTVGGRR